MRSRTITIIAEADEKKPAADSKSEKGKTIEKEKVEQGLLDKLVSSEDLTKALDVISAIGVGIEAVGGALSWTGAGAVAAGTAAAVSAAADLTNAVRMAAKGDLLNAGMYALFAVPVFGDALQGAKITGLAGKGGVEIIMKVLKFSKTQRAVKAMETAHDMIDKIPGDSERRKDIKGAVTVIMSGDAARIASLATKSGDKELADEIEKRVGGESEKKELSEARRSRSLLPLYERSLYGRND